MKTVVIFGGSGFIGRNIIHLLVRKDFRLIVPYQQPINDIHNPCSDLWRRMFVWWDGKINPCDVDFKSHLFMGDASSEGLSELWRSTRYTNLRENHQGKRRSECMPCNRCKFV